MSNVQIPTINIGFIGGGNMAQAIISGLLNNGFVAKNIMVSDPVDGVREILSEKGVQTTQDNQAVLSFCDTLVLAVKPQLFELVLSPLSAKLTNQLVISIAAGIEVKQITHLLKYDNIVRAMPNTPALIGEGATGVYVPHSVSVQHKEWALQILQATGLVVEVDTEAKLHAVTAVSGSAPAYFFYVMESMIAAGTELGLTDEQATALTLQTALGSAKMAQQSQDTPSILRNKVTSPNGTTHAAIESMKVSEIDKKIAQAMQSCVDRSIEISNTAS